MTKKITIITPCFNEEESIRECYEAVKTLFQEQLVDYEREHIICDNASSDGTVEILRQIAAGDPKIKVILNSRNFGVYPSVHNALATTSGDAVVPLFPADLQDPAETIIEFVRHWEDGNEVVFGQRKIREENLAYRSLRKIYYRVINRLASFEIPVDVGDFQLLDRKVVHALLQYNDHQPYLRGLVAECGFESVIVPYTWRKREKGKSKTNLYALVNVGLNGLVSSTRVPVRICLFAGTLVTLASVLVMAFQAVRMAVYPGTETPSDFFIIITVLSFFGGLNLFFIGLIGEYVMTVHAQVRGGPGVVENERINF